MKSTLSRGERIFGSPIIILGLCTTCIVITSLHTENESQVTQHLCLTSRALLRGVYFAFLHTLVYLSGLALSILCRMGVSYLIWSLQARRTVFAIYLVWYDSTGTVNPGWLNWLG